MNQLKLRLDDIRVNGFEVLPSEAAVMGTVQGADLTRLTFCNQDTCFQTCDQATCLY